MELIEAVKKNDLKKVNRLIAAGADVNKKDDFGATALMWTSCNGYTNIVKALLKAGADVNAKDNNENTALILASGKGYTDIVNILKKKSI